MFFFLLTTDCKSIHLTTNSNNVRNFNISEVVPDLYPDITQISICWDACVLGFVLFFLLIWWILNIECQQSETLVYDLVFCSLRPKTVCSCGTSTDEFISSDYYQFRVGEKCWNQSKRSGGRLLFTLSIITVGFSITNLSGFLLSHGDQAAFPTLWSSTNSLGKSHLCGASTGWSCFVLFKKKKEKKRDGYRRSGGTV